MRYLLLVALLAFTACAAEVEGENEDLAVSEEALIQGCHGHVVIQAKAGALYPSPYGAGRVWDLVSAGGVAGCLYVTAGYDYLYSANYPGGCAKYNERTWYCSGAGIVDCPVSAGLSRPTQGADNPFGPYESFSRWHTSYHSEVSEPFSHSYWDAQSKRVVCGYNTAGKQYRYTPYGSRF